MVLLIVLAALLTMLLLGSASSRIADASRADEGGPGSWGVLQRHHRRRRALPAQARRWQTAISRADDDGVRWAQLVDYLDSLEAAAGGRPDVSARPDRLESRYLRSRIDDLQAELDRADQLRNPAPLSGVTPTNKPQTPGTAGQEKT